MCVTALVVANIVANNTVVASETFDTVDKVLTDDVLELSTAGCEASTKGGDMSAMVGLYCIAKQVIRIVTIILWRELFLQQHTDLFRFQTMLTRLLDCFENATTK